MQNSTIDDVGTWHYCPACGQPTLPPLLDSEDQNSEHFNYEDVRCSGCGRPWIACPCRNG